MNRKIGVYLYDFANGSGEQIYLPYSVGTVWSFAKNDPEIDEAFRLKGVSFCPPGAVTRSPPSSTRRSRQVPNRASSSAKGLMRRKKSSFSPTERW